MSAHKLLVMYCLRTIGTAKAVRYTEKRGGRETGSTIPKSDAVGNKVSVRHRQDGHASEVVVKMGSTVYCSIKIGS